MRATDPNPKPSSRKLRPSCGATPGGCNGLHFMAGRKCCEACDLHNGNHDRDDS